MLKRYKSAVTTALCVLLASALLSSCGLSGKADQPEASAFTYPFILPNTYIGDVDVSGLGKADALAQLNSYYQGSAAPASVTVTISGRTFLFSPAQSITVTDAEALVNAAYDQRRTGDDKADYEAAKDTEYRMDVSTALVIDQDDLDRQVKQAIESLEENTVSSCYEISDDTILLTLGEPKVKASASELSALVTGWLESGVTEAEYQVETIPVEEVNLDELYKTFTVEARNAAYDPDTLEVIESVEGRTFDLESAKAAYNLLSSGQSCTVDIIKTIPQITTDSIGDRLYFDLLGSCDSTLEGSTSNRRTNLTLVCEAINGTVLQPGEVFSFNDTVGERTAAKGYKTAGVYIGGQTQDQVGGGICQAASTIYLSSLRANLEVVERHPHDYLVTYVPMGCDATIYWGVYDYKFRNSTAFPLRIDAWVADDYVHVELWGTNLTGQYAEMTYEVLSTTPYGYETIEDETKDVGYSQITTYPYTGYSVNTYRNVYDKDGNLLSSTFEVKTNYKTRNQVTVVGAKPEAPPEPETPVQPSTPSDTPVEAPVTPTPEPMPEIDIVIG